MDSSTIKHFSVTRLTFSIPSRSVKPFGLGIISRNDRVYVSSVTPDSVASDYFKNNDKIRSINGHKVSSKAECENILREAVKKRNIKRVRISVERRQMIEKPYIEVAEKAHKSSRSKHKVNGLDEHDLAKDKLVKLPHIDYELFTNKQQDVNIVSKDPMKNVNLKLSPDIQIMINRQVDQILADFTNLSSSSSRTYGRKRRSTGRRKEHSRGTSAKSNRGRNVRHSLTGQIVEGGEDLEETNTSSASGYETGGQHVTINIKAEQVEIGTDINAKTELISPQLQD